MDTTYPAKWLGMNSIRLLARMANRSSVPADFISTYSPTSSPSNRQLQLRVYLPRTVDPRNLPVHMHVHGSGFCLPGYGFDAEYSQWLAEAVPCVVVDADHRKPPEYPAPVPANDVRDGLKAVRGLAVERGWNAERMSIGGMSSGACLSLIEAARAGKNGEELCAVIAFYPSIDLSISPYDKPQRAKSPGATGAEMPPGFRQFLYSCLLPASSNPDRKSPSISPFYADPQEFPSSITIITCEKDSLRDEAHALVRKLEDARHQDVVHFEAKGQGRGWNLSTTKGTEPDRIKWEAYELVRDGLREAYRM